MKDMKNFESSLLELETIVKKLESDIPLDEAVSAFEAGIVLCKSCMEGLKSEKGKLTLLVDDLKKLTEEFKLD